MRILQVLTIAPSSFGTLREKGREGGRVRLRPIGILLLSPVVFPERPRRVERVEGERQKKGSFYIPQYTGIREIQRCGGFSSGGGPCMRGGSFFFAWEPTLFWGGRKKSGENPPFFIRPLFLWEIGWWSQEEKEEEEEEAPLVTRWRREEEGGQLIRVRAAEKKEEKRRRGKGGL